MWRDDSHQPLLDLRNSLSIPDDQIDPVELAEFAEEPLGGGDIHDADAAGHCLSQPFVRQQRGDFQPECAIVSEHVDLAARFYTVAFGESLREQDGVVSCQYSQ